MQRHGTTDGMRDTNDRMMFLNQQRIEELKNCKLCKVSSKAKQMNDFKITNVNSLAGLGLVEARIDLWGRGYSMNETARGTSDRAQRRFLDKLNGCKYCCQIR